LPQVCEPVARDRSARVRPGRLGDVQSDLRIRTARRLRVGSALVTFRCGGDHSTHARFRAARPLRRVNRFRSGRTRTGRPSAGRTRRWRSMKRALVEDRATRSAPWLPRTDEWCSAGTSDPGIPSVVLITSGASSGEVSRAACSSLSQTVCAPRCSWLGEGFVVLRRARFAEYSLCHHVCRIFHRC
jgi:hypothetical protein